MKTLLIVLFFLLFFIVPPTVHGQETTPLSVPGEVIVTYKEGQTPNDLKVEAEKRESLARTPIIGGILSAITSIGQTTPEKRLERIKKVKSDRDVTQEKNVFQSKDNKLSNTFLIRGDDTEELEKSFKALPEIESVTPNYIAQINVSPNDQYYSQMWNLSKIKMADAWNKSQGSNTITVAVVDSGVNYNHPDLVSNVQKGYDFTTCNYIDPNSGNCVQTKPRDNDPMDEHGHGTHVSGTIGAVTNNTIGVSGINWNIKILAVRVMNAQGYGEASDILEGIRYATDNGARVINLSLGLRLPCSQIPAYRDAINYARSKNTTVVVAAGNDSMDAINYTPASCNGVIAVAASTESDTRASFSNYGSVVDIAAPGTNILSTWSSGYKSLQGTSMAAPHVAGIAALILSVNSSLSPDQVESTIKNNSDTISSTSISGRRLNASKAIDAVSTGQPTPTPTTPTSTSTPTPSSTPTPTKTPTPTLTPTGTVAPTPTPTNTPTLTPSPTLTGVVTISPTQSQNCTLKSRGDATCDGLVNPADFIRWKQEYTGSMFTQTADFNGANGVDSGDFIVWKNGYLDPTVPH